MPSTTGTFDEGDLLRALGRNLSNPARVMKRLGFLVQTRAKKAFTDQKRGPFTWKPRSVPNVPGILADLREGKRDIPARRFEARPALVDRGDLLASISKDSAVAVEGSNVVRVGSNRPYAALHQHGGEVDIPIDDALKEKIAALLKRMAGKAKYAERKAFGFGPSSGDFAGAARASGRAEMLRKALGPYLRKNVRGITWRVPARPFVVVDDQDRADLSRMAAELMLGGP